MTSNPWLSLAGVRESGDPLSWLNHMLHRNRDTVYLRQFDSPQTLAAYRAQLPVCDYDDLVPWLMRLQAGAADLLFAGRPVAYERTGGSSGGSKLIPYSAEGLQDFQHDIVPWLARSARDHQLSGLAYFAISPATRQPESLGGVAVGLPDAAYLGPLAGPVLAAASAVPLAVGGLADVSEWRRQTVAHLQAAADLELISVWSPTFLLRLLDHIPDPQACWPRLKLVSCWASGPARRFADEVRARLPHAALQPKGLLSTEAVITVPGASGQPVAARHVFIEYEQGSQLLLDDALQADEEYGIVVTTASGLYRYRTGDRVQFLGRDPAGQPVLEFVGRGNLYSDLVGEKLSEPFVARCLQGLPGHSLLLADGSHAGYVLICEQADAATVQYLEQRLRGNPQYAYARHMGQLAPLRCHVVADPWSVVEQAMLQRGVRLGDIKPLALRPEPFWLTLFKVPPA